MSWHNAFITFVDPPPGEPPRLPEGDHHWLRAELHNYLSRDVSPLAVVIPLLAFDFDIVAPIWSALAAVESFQALLHDPLGERDAVTGAALAVMALHAERLELLSGGALWPFLSECRVAYYRETLHGCPGHSARLLLARHLLSHPDLVGAGWGDGPTAVNAYMNDSGDEAFAADLLAAPGPLPESVRREIARRFPRLAAAAGEYPDQDDRPSARGRG